MDTQEVIPTTQKKDKGFTLVELLIVIVILGILATITVFAVSGITDNAETTACTTDKRTIEAAAEAFFAGEGAYPATITILGTPTADNETYLKNLPSLAAWQDASIADGTVEAVVDGPCDI